MPLLKSHPYFSNVFIELSPGATHDWNARCFRFDEQGNSEYTSYGTLANVGAQFARWYGHSFKRGDFTFL